MRKFFSAIAVASIIAGYAWYTFLVAPNSDVSAKSENGNFIGKHRPEYALPDIDGTIHRPGQWDGKVVLVNFWATWCPPCRKEMPGFVRVKAKYATQGFDIVGIAIDHKDAVAAFSNELHLNYTVLHGQAEASMVSREYGDTVGALPYSVLLDRDGKIRFTKAGELTEKELESRLKSLL